MWHDSFDYLLTDVQAGEAKVLKPSGKLTLKFLSHYRVGTWLHGETNPLPLNQWEPFCVLPVNGQSNWESVMPVPVPGTRTPILHIAWKINFSIFHECLHQIYTNKKVGQFKPNHVAITTKVIFKKQASKQSHPQTHSQYTYLLLAGVQLFSLTG